MCINYSPAVSVYSLFVCPSPFHLSRLLTRGENKVFPHIVFNTLFEYSQFHYLYALVLPRHLQHPPLPLRCTVCDSKQSVIDDRRAWANGNCRSHPPPLSFTEETRPLWKGPIVSYHANDNIITSLQCSVGHLSSLKNNKLLN